MKKVSFGIFGLLAAVVMLIAILGVTLPSQSAVTLKWWVGTWLWENGKAQEMAKRFQEKYPNIKIEPIPQPYKGYLEKQIMVLRAKNPPDLLNTHILWTCTLAPTGGLMDVTEEINKLGGTNYFFEGPLEGTEYNGKYFGFPYRTSAEFLVWNKEIFKAAGLDPELPPTTWSEVLLFAKWITERTGYPGFAVSGVRPHSPWEFRRLALNFGGSIVDNPTSPRKATINEAPVILAGKYYQELMKSGVLPKSVLSDTMDDIKLIFSAGRLGMFIATPAYLSLFNEAGINYGEATIPGYGWGKIGVEPTLAFMLSISAYTKHREEALKFARFLVRPEQDAYFTEALPAVKEAVKYAKFKNPKFRVPLKQMEYTVPPMKFKEREEVNIVIEEAVQKILLGKDVEQVLNAAAEKIDKIIQR